jgi:hypothetical protein
LINFNLKLTNPSTAAVLQKLELWEKKLDIAGKAKDLPHVDEEVIQKEIFGFNDADIIRIRLGREQDTIRNKTFEALQPVQSQPGQEPDQFDSSNYDVPGGGAVIQNIAGGVSAPLENDLQRVPQIDTSESEIVKVTLPDKTMPIKPNFSIPSKLFPSLIKTSNFDKQIVNPYFGMNMATSQKTNFETLKERDEYYNSLLKESFKETTQNKIPTSGIYKEVVSSLKNYKKFLSENKQKQEIENTEIEIEIEKEKSDFKPFYGLISKNNSVKEE